VFGLGAERRSTTLVLAPEVCTHRKSRTPAREKRGLEEREKENFI